MKENDCMKKIANRIDRSVNFLKQKESRGTGARAIPLVAISAAEELKACLVRKLSAEYSAVDARLVHQAINEAHALAALTGVPLLVLPALAEEKVRAASVWSARQRAVRD